MKDCVEKGGARTYDTKGAPTKLALYGQLAGGNQPILLKLCDAFLAWWLAVHGVFCCRLMESIPELNGFGGGFNLQASEDIQDRRHSRSKILRKESVTSQ